MGQRSISSFDPIDRESEGGEKIILLFWPDGPWARKVPLLICMRFFGPWDSLNLTWACMTENHSPLFVLMGLESESSPYTFVWEELDSSWGVFGDQFREFFPFTPFICMVASETRYILYSPGCKVHGTRLISASRITFVHSHRIYS